MFHITTLFSKKLLTLAAHYFCLEQHKDIRNIFGENLRRFRLQKALSQRGLHAICGIDHGMISRMENGEVNVTLNTMNILATALGVKVCELVKGEESAIKEVG